MNYIEAIVNRTTNSKSNSKLFYDKITGKVLQKKAIKRV